MPDTDADRIRELLAGMLKYCCVIRDEPLAALHDEKRLAEFLHFLGDWSEQVRADMPRACAALEGVVGRLDKHTALLSERQQSTMTWSQIFAYINRSTDAGAMLADIRRILEGTHE